MLHDRFSVALHLLQLLPAALDGRYLPLGRLTVLLQLRQLSSQLVSIHDPFGGEVEVAAPLTVEGGKPFEPRSGLDFGIAPQGASLLLYHGVEALLQPLGVGEQAGDEIPDLRVRFVGADALVVGTGLLPAVGLPASVVADYALLPGPGPVVAVHGLHRALAHPAAHERTGELPEPAAQLGRGAVPGDRSPCGVHPL